MSSAKLEETLIEECLRLRVRPEEFSHKMETLANQYEQAYQRAITPTGVTMERAIEELLDALDTFRTDLMDISEEKRRSATPYVREKEEVNTTLFKQLRTTPVFRDDHGELRVANRDNWDSTKDKMVYSIQPSYFCPWEMLVLAQFKLIDDDMVARKKEWLQESGENFQTKETIFTVQYFKEVQMSLDGYFAGIPQFDSFSQKIKQYLACLEENGHNLGSRFQIFEDLSDHDLQYDRLNRRHLFVDGGRYDLTVGDSDHWNDAFFRIPRVYQKLCALREEHGRQKVDGGEIVFGYQPNYLFVGGKIQEHERFRGKLEVLSFVMAGSNIRRPEDYGVY